MDIIHNPNYFYSILYIMKKIIIIVSMTILIIIWGYVYKINEDKNIKNDMIVAFTQFDSNQISSLFLDSDYINNTLWHYQKNLRTQKIYYLPVQNNKKWMNIITWVDYDSFTPINLQRSKDKNYYYLDGKITDLVTEFNPIMLGAGSYIVDDNYVYDGAWEKIEWIDRKSFQLLGIWTMYAKDKNHIYIGSNIFTGVDYESFEWLNRNYAKDKGNVYIGRNIVTWADSMSFESLFRPVLDNEKENILYDSKDNNNYYKNWIIVLL
jgi:hypothetical protein